MQPPPPIVRSRVCLFAGDRPQPQCQYLLQSVSEQLVRVRAISFLSPPSETQQLATLPSSHPPHKQPATGERKPRAGLPDRYVHIAGASTYKRRPISTASLSEH